MMSMSATGNTEHTDLQGTGMAGEGLGCNQDELDALRQDILDHLERLRLPVHGRAEGQSAPSKDAIRASHAPQRCENFRREQRALGRRWERLLDNFASGSDIRPEAIDPELIPVEAERESGDLFRLATLCWSVPVSRGFGRRMRYLVRDRSNGKLIGVFALGDPVFNLRVRDAWIGWSVNDRRARLVNVMDGYVVGAVPPYAQLLGGKLVASLIGSAEVGEAFAIRYGASTGIISGEQKGARLALVTITSALGRSSLYNRLRLTVPPPDESKGATIMELKRLGSTQGYGHFQLSESLFARLRDVLIKEHHAYASGHQYGQGPNWRLRVARVALERLGLSGDLLRHGIARDVYAMPLAANVQDYLAGRAATLTTDQPSVRCIAAAARTRWMVPRAVRCPDYQLIQREDLLLQAGPTQRLLGNDQLPRAADIETSTGLLSRHDQ